MPLLILPENKFASLIYNFLLDHWQLQNGRRTGKYWNMLWDWSLRRFSSSIITTNVHGRRVFANFGHTYPLFARKFPHWNNPLLELVNQSHKVRNRPITVVDVGAGIGDTTLLIESNCAGMVAKFLCIEGDLEFFRFLSVNLGSDSKYLMENVMLSSAQEEIPNLIRTHPGTGSAQGTHQVLASTLNDVVKAHALDYIDLIKIDVDGFEGRVLAGSHLTLEQYHPTLIFEWDPFFCEQTGNNWTEHFTLLNSLGYERFIWFAKYGDFSHFMTGFDRDAISRLADVCLSGKHDYNWHYDIIALHHDDLISDVDIATLQNAKKRRSWY